MNFIFWGIFILPGAVSTLGERCIEIEGWECSYYNTNTKRDRIVCRDKITSNNQLLISHIYGACKYKLVDRQFTVEIYGQSEKSAKFFLSGFTLDLKYPNWNPQYLYLFNITLVEVENCGTVTEIICIDCGTYKINKELLMNTNKCWKSIWNNLPQYFVYNVYNENLEEKLRRLNPAKTDAELKKEYVNDNNCYEYCTSNYCGWRISEDNCHNFATNASCQSFCDKHNCKILLDTNTIDCTANCPNNCPNTTPCSTCPALTTSIPTTIIPEIKKDDEALTKTLRVSLLTVILVLTIVIALLHTFPDKHEQVLQETPQQEEDHQENYQQAFEYESYYEDPNLFRS